MRAHTRTHTHATQTHARAGARTCAAARSARLGGKDPRQRPGRARRAAAGRRAGVHKAPLGSVLPRLLLVLLAATLVLGGDRGRLASAG